MKLKNNLTKEAIENMYREQGYSVEQIKELIYSLENDLGLEKYVTPDVIEEHMDTLNTFLENSIDIEQFFEADGTLDVATLEQHSDIYTRHILGYY